MGLNRFFRRAKWDRDRLEELDSYIQIETDENIARGMPADEARAAARRKLGNRTLIREEIYGMNTIAFLDTFSRDVRYGLRTLRRNPMFAAAALMTLAIGIGANTAVFTVVNSVLIRPLPYPQPDALVGVWHSAQFQGMTTNRIRLSSTMYLTYGEHNQTFEEFGVWHTGAANVTGIGEPEEVRTLVVTHGTLPAVGVPPALGRWFSQADDTPGTPETVILTDGYWQRRFGADKAAIGRTITIDSRPREVIGVMPQGFRFVDSDPEVILPQRFEGDQLLANDVHRYVGIARLKSGVSLAQANADVGRMLPIWITEYGTSGPGLRAAGFAPALRPLKQDVVGDVGQVLWVLLGTIGMVLLIACANVANLLLVRAEGRQQELAVRAALGAGWGRIVRELLLESVLLGLMGAVLGSGLAYAGLRVLVAMGPVSLPRLGEISIDPQTLGFTLVVSLLSSLLFGLIPALKYAGPRMSMALQGGLHGGGRTVSQSRERHRSQNTLVVVQVALALVLLTGSGLMIRSFQALRGVQPGFARPEQIQTVRISIPDTQVEDPERVVRMQNEILEKIVAIPGVASVAFATALPMEMEFENNMTLTAEDKTYAEGIPPLRRSKFVSPGLFETLGTPVIAGRDLTWTDIHDRRETAIISENMAREMWGEPSAALGKRIRVGRVGAWNEIIGVVGDVYDSGVHQEAPAIVYWRAGVQAPLVRPLVAERGAGIPSYTPRAVTFAILSIRTGREDFLKQVREAVWTVNPNLPLASIRTLQDVYDQSLARTSFTLVMLAIAGSMALALGIIGIYGVISYAVSRRSREMGIRLALGAQQRELTRMFVRHGLILTSIGVAIGLGAAAGLTRLMSSLLFGIGPLDPITYAAVPVILVLAAALASYLPARRAAAVDPVEALKAE